MSCLITSGYTPSCPQPAGIKKLYFINTEEIDTITKTNGEVTTLTLESTKKAYIFNVEQEITTITEKSIGSKENNTYAYETTLSTQITGNSATLLTAMDTLSKARVTVIAENNDGTYELLFEQFGTRVNIERTNEAKFEGFNGYKITATHRQTEKICTVASSVMSTLPTD